MTHYQYLIIGGGAAGVAAIDGIRGVDGEGSIALVSAERHLPYRRPGLARSLLAGQGSLADLTLHPRSYYADQGVELLLGRKAVKLYRPYRWVRLANGDRLYYDKLLLATGARAWRLPLPGAELPNVHTLRTLDDAEAIRTVLGNAPPHNVVVIGNNAQALQVAQGLARRSDGRFPLRTTLLCPQAQLLSDVAPPSLAGRVGAAAQAQGIRLLTGRWPAAFVGTERVEALLLDDDTTLPADLVIMAAGVRLNTVLAREASLQLAEHSAIVVDEHLRTDDPNIYAAGEIAALPMANRASATLGRRLQVINWEQACVQGRIAGRNMAGSAETCSTLTHRALDLFGVRLEIWGDLGHWDYTLARDSGKTIYYLHREQLIAALAIAPSEAIRQRMDDLVAAAPTYRHLSAAL